MVTKLKLGDREISWELVYKRNKVERLKDEKFPLDILDELPDFIEDGYESIPEDDIVRLYWHGIVHDKPKIGKFMVRLKVPCGIVTPDQLRGVGRIAEQYGDNYSELTTRMGIQLHEVELKHLPEVVDAIQDTGLSNKGAEGDTVRNITGCPLTGIDPRETFNVRPVIEQAHEFFSGNPDYSDLPRKLKFTVTACPLQCSGPEFHGIALLGVIHKGRRGFAVRTGGGLSSTPRIARDLGVFVPEDEALDVLQGLTDLWDETLRYRLSRPKSRIKFMVDDHGPEKIRRVLEERLDREFEDLEAPDPVHGDLSHLGVLPQKQEGRYALGYSISQGWVKGHQLRELADVLEEVGGEARFTRDQNFILVDLPEDQLDGVVDRVAEIGFPLEERNRIFGHSVACTSHRYCNFSVAKTKEKAQEILRELDERFGSAIEQGLTVKMDGCPHACGQHWMGNIGLQGTTARSDSGDKIDAYDVTLRGGLGSEVKIGKTLLRKIPTDEINGVIVRLIEAWLEWREDPDPGNDGETTESPGGADGFQAFCNEHTDRKLQAIGLGKPPENVDGQDHVQLRFSGPLVQLTGGIELHEIRSSRAQTVRSLINSVTRRYESLKSEIPLEEGEWSDHVNLFLNDEDIRERDGLETSLQAGDEVLAMPALSGGSRAARSNRSKRPPNGTRRKNVQLPVDRER